MRIAHFLLGRCNPESPNGIDKTVFFLSRAQARLGHDVAVVSLTDKTPIPIPGVDVITAAPVTIPFLAERSRVGDLALRSSFRLPRMVVDTLVGWRPDVLHLHSVHNSQNIVLARWANSAKIPYCVSLHGGLSPAAQARRTWPKLIFGFLFERRYLERAAFVHVNGDPGVEGLQAYGVSGNTMVAPNGIDRESLPLEMNSDVLFSNFPELAGKRIFMFLGRLDPDQKGLDLLLEAFALSRPQDSSLVLVGPDWCSKRAQLESLVEHLGMSGKVVFTGAAFGQQKYDYLSAADVFVHTSRWEGAPFSVLEAAAVGKPLLLSDAADPSDMIERYRAGLRVAPTVVAISAAVDQLSVADETHLKAMGSGAREAVHVDFGWIPIARKFAEAYATHAS